MMDILPAVLTSDEQDFHDQLLHPELRKAAHFFHLDVLDNTLVRAICWADPLIIGTWHNLPEVELHFMVQNPLAHLETWRIHVPTVRRVIVHLEIGPTVQRVLEQARSLHIETFLAVNPSTHVDALAPYIGLISGVQIMGVVPGKSGQPFLGSPILAKIKRAKALFPHLFISVDGGVSLATIHDIAKAGAQRCVVSSALWKAENPAEALEELRNRVR